MNTLDIIQAVASVLGVLVAALGFYFVSRQLRKSAHSDIHSLSVAVKTALLENPDLRKYFFEEEPMPPKGHDARDRLLILVDMFCLYLEQITIHADDLGGEKEAWLEYVRIVHDQSPAIQEQFQRIPYASVLYETIGVPYSGTKPTAS